MWKSTLKKATMYVVITKSKLWYIHSWLKGKEKISVKLFMKTLNSTYEKLEKEIEKNLFDSSLLCILYKKEMFSLELKEMSSLVVRPLSPSSFRSSQALSRGINRQGMFSLNREDYSFFNLKSLVKGLSHEISGVFLAYLYSLFESLYCFKIFSVNSWFDIINEKNFWRGLRINHVNLLNKSKCRESINALLQEKLWLLLGSV